MRDLDYVLSDREIIKLKFTETYHLAYIVDRLVVENSTLDGSFSDYWGEAGESYLEPYRQWSALHMYVEYVTQQVIDRDFTRAEHRLYVPSGQCTGWMCSAVAPYLLVGDLLKDYDLEDAGISNELSKWVTSGCHYCPEPDGSVSPDWSELWERLLLESDYGWAVENLAEEVFYVLFANRTFLYHFNKMISAWVECVDPSSPRLRKDRSNGLRLRRAKIPSWVRQAVFFRDRGRCCQCGKTLAATYSRIDLKEYDHIVPLGSGGLNDVSNLQLLCRVCNSSKSAHDIPPSPIYERWFEVRRPQH